MPRPQLKNFAICTVSTGYDAAATSIVLTTGHGAKLPGSAPYWVEWWNNTDYPDPANDPNVEFVQVTARSGDTLTVTRGQDGTSGTTKNTAGKTYKMQLVDNAALFDDVYTRHLQAGCGRFVYVSTTSCRLDPFNGNKILINGALETIPDAGVSISNGGLTSATVYYAYVYLSSGTLTGEFSTTAPARDTTYGHQIKTGDATRSLVGIIRTNGSSQFADGETQRFVASWLNPYHRDLYVSFSQVTFTYTGTASELDSAKRLEWVQFDGRPTVIVGGRVRNNTAGSTAFIGIRFDATTNYNGTVSGGHSASANYEFGVCAPYAANLGAGYHYVTVTGVVSANTGILAEAAFTALVPG